MKYLFEVLQAVTHMITYESQPTQIAVKYAYCDQLFHKKSTTVIGLLVLEVF